MEPVKMASAGQASAAMNLIDLHQRELFGSHTTLGFIRMVKEKVSYEDADRLVHALRYQNWGTAKTILEVNGVI